MDIGHLEKVINDIELKPQIVRGIAEYCVLNGRGSEMEIARELEKGFKSHIIEQKLAIVEVISEIFLMTSREEQESRFRFLKPLTTKTRMFIEEISQRVSEIKPEHINIIPRMLANWSNPEGLIFSPQYMQKLRKSAGPILIRAKKLEEEKRNGIFENYTKTFLMEYEDIKSFEPTSRIYEDHVLYVRIMEEVGVINTEIIKLESDKSNPQASNRAAELYKSLNKQTEKLQDLICNCHIDLKILRAACREELQKLPQQAKIIMEKLGS